MSEADKELRTHIKDFPIVSTTREFKYIDAMPGAGKTEYFVNRAVEYVAGGKSEMPYIYAAPTIELLVEAQKRIFEQLDKKFHKQVMIVVSTKHPSLEKYTGANYLVEPPANAMNYRLGLYKWNKSRTERQIYESAKLSKGQRFGLPEGRDLYKIKILMITHEAFVRIKKVAEPERYFPLLNSTVFFDEARQCVTREVSLNSSGVSNHEVKNLEKLLRFKYIEGTEVKSPNGKSTAYFLISGMVTDKKKIAKAIGAKFYKDLSRGMRGFLNKLLESCVTGRNTMTVRIAAKVRNGWWVPDFGGASFLPFVVMRPTDLFSGYQEVILLSAMFKDSQMWHILKNEETVKHRFTNMLDYSFVQNSKRRVKKSLESIKKRHEQNLDVIQSRLRVIPLTSSASALSLNYLNTSCMLPVELDAKINEVTEAGTTSATRSDLLRSVISGGVIGNDKQVTEQLKKYMVPPLWVAMRAAYQALRKAGCEQALLFINTKSGYRVWEPEEIRYIDILRDILKYGDGAEEHLTSKERSQKNKVDPRWIKWLSQACHGKKKFFLVPSTTSVRGLNTYTEHTGYVHLAALNQRPDMCMFFSAIFPTYNVELDTVIDNVLQTLYRTNLREPDSKKKIYMVTANQHSIDQLAWKLFNDERKVFRVLAGYTPRLTALSYRGKLEIEYKIKAGKAKRKYPEEVAKELNKAKAALRNAKSSVKKNPKTIEKWESKIRALEERAVRGNLTK